MIHFRVVFWLYAKDLVARIDVHNVFFCTTTYMSKLYISLGLILYFKLWQCCASHDSLSLGIRTTWSGLRKGWCSLVVCHSFTSRHDSQVTNTWYEHDMTRFVETSLWYIATRCEHISGLQLVTHAIRPPSLLYIIRKNAPEILEFLEIQVMEEHHCSG